MQHDKPFRPDTNTHLECEHDPYVETLVYGPVAQTPAHHPLELAEGKQAARYHGDVEKDLDTLDECFSYEVGLIRFLMRQAG